MANYTPSQAQKEIFITQMTQRMAEIARKLSDWVASGPRTLEEMEKMTLQIVKELGNALLGSLISLNVPPYPEEYVPCPCGQKAIYQRMRSIHVDTLLGTITIKRPYYLCPSCHHGYAPLDQKLGVCAGGISSGLEEILALMGAQLPFEEAVKMVAKLSLVEEGSNRKGWKIHCSKGGARGRRGLGFSSPSGEDSRTPLCLHRWNYCPYP